MRRESEFLQTHAEHTEAVELMEHANSAAGVGEGFASRAPRGEFDDAEFVRCGEGFVVFVFQAIHVRLSVGSVMGVASGRMEGEGVVG